MLYQEAMDHIRKKKSHEKYMKPPLMSKYFKYIISISCINRTVREKMTMAVTQL